LVGVSKGGARAETIGEGNEPEERG
jgi:hypothetical protein